MLYIKIGEEEIPVPREVNAGGAVAVQGFIEGQVARIEKENEPKKKHRRAPNKEEE